MSETYGNPGSDSKFKIQNSKDSKGVRDVENRGVTLNIEPVFAAATTWQALNVERGSYAYKRVQLHVNVCRFWRVVEENNFEKTPGIRIVIGKLLPGTVFAHLFRL